MSDFQGHIGKTWQESTPWWPQPVHPGADAPNVIVILIDDLGFGHFSCFGGDVPTPNIDALAADGLRYTNYHVTPSAPPRAPPCSRVVITTTWECGPSRTSTVDSPTCAAH